MRFLRASLISIFLASSLFAGEEVQAIQMNGKPLFSKHKTRDSLNTLVLEEMKKNCFQIGILADYYGSIRHEGENPFFLTQGLMFGLETDYRRNFFHKFGIRVGNQLAAGFPEFSIFRDSSLEKKPAKLNI